MTARNWQACEVCGKPSHLLTVTAGQLACPACFDAAWDAEIDAEAARFARALDNLGRPGPTIPAKWAQPTEENA